MTPVPVLWKRSRHTLFRITILLCSFAMVAGLAVATAATPAHAQPVTSGGPYTLTYSGGDVVATEDVAGISPSTMSSDIGTTWPESVGLSPGASLSSLFRATWKKYADGTVPEPPSFSGGSSTVTSDGAGGSTVTIDIPSADVSANYTIPGWLAKILSVAAGYAAYALAVATCHAVVVLYLAPAEITGTPAVICNGFGVAAWTLAGAVVYQVLTKKPFNADFWVKTLAATVTGFFTGVLAGSENMAIGLREIMVTVLRALIKGVVKTVNGVIKLVGFIKKFVGNAWTAVLNAIQRFLRRGQRRADIEMPNIESRAGLPTPRSSGAVSNTAGSSNQPGVPVGARCMDAYGSSDGTLPGQIVAINSCNGNPAQKWNYYPDGPVSVWGLCLDTASGTSQIVLETCDGSSGQSWTESGATLVNKASSLCLDDPGGNTTPGTQLDVAACNGSAAQDWRLPAAQACDIYAAHGTACVAAYSMTRALYAAYDGPLYQVQRSSDGTTASIGLLNTGGDVNAATQDSFCSGTTCTITEIYDQSGAGNNLTIEGAGGAAGPDHGAIATALPVKINGHKAYGVDIEPGTGYRDNTTLGIATGDMPEGMYMVASGTHVNSGCCFDFGNVEANSHDNGASHMDAVNLTTWCGSNSQPCSGNGPWVEADLENGQWMGNGSNPANKGNSTPFVTAMLRNNGTTTFSLKGGDSTSGGLSTWYNGPLPSGYSPMHLEGGVVMGTGGDNSNSDVGSWFEGVMTAGYPSDAADNAVQASIVAAGYSGTTNPAPGAGTGAAASAAGPAVVHAAGATGQASSGFSSMYTVNSANGHLQETYLPYMGASWTTQDLSAKYGTPPVLPGTKPVALVHCGFTSVYTVDAANGHLQETYLPKIGDPWTTQDLTAKYGTPPTKVTPTAVMHSAGAAGATPGCGYTSVYTVNYGGGLQETYLPSAGFPGDAWHTQNLSAKYGTPHVAPGTHPVALVHMGYTSVYTVDQGSEQLQETYLPKIGDPWNTQSLSANYGTPATDQTPVVLLHPDTSGVLDWTSVFTIDKLSDHLQETYLPSTGFPGDAWHTQDLSAKYGTPAVRASLPAPAGWAVDHIGYTSTYTVDAPGNNIGGDLQETYLPHMGGSWTTQNLTKNYGTPTVNPVTQPVAATHDGYTSVFSIDASDGDLQETYLPGTGFPGDAWHTQNLHKLAGTPPSATTPAVVFHGGYLSVYTVDASDGHLWETYLPSAGFPGDAWHSQDLTKNYGAPVVLPGTSPAAIVHDGFTSVYTVDASDGHLQETYLPAIGDPWHSQDLSKNYHTPPVLPGTSPAAIVHDGYTSVYTIDNSGNDLQETYLPYMGGSWTTQNLSVKYGTPPVADCRISSCAPVVLYHTGFTSVYTIDKGSDDVQETYLPAIGDPWTTQNLTTKYHTPASAQETPAALLHYNANGGLTWTSVFTVNNLNDVGNTDLQETYLPKIGGSWTSQNLSVKYGTPPVF